MEEILVEEYDRFISRKSQLGGKSGFDPVWMPSFLFDFQQALVEWALVKGKAAIFADCGALAHNRRGIGVELKPSYYHQAVKNIAATIAHGLQDDNDQMILAANEGAC